MNQVMEKAIRVPLAQELGDWFSKSNGDVVSVELIAQAMKKFRVQMKLANANEPVYAKDVSSIIPRMREHLELSKRLTVVYVRPHGYKIATPYETAVYGMKTYRTTIKWADRCARISDIIDPKHIPQAFKEVFGDADSARRMFQKKTREFLVTCDVEKKKEILKRRKLIEAQLEKEAHYGSKERRNLVGISS